MNHALRPLLVLVVLASGALAARSLLVPRDFGVGPGGYMYGWHRQHNEEEWKDLPAVYRGSEYCKGCHADKHNSIQKSGHATIACENCHGPAQNHPDAPARLEVHRERALCLRCHAALPYPGSGRARIPDIDPVRHNAGIECATCHNPHNPRPGGSR